MRRRVSKPSAAPIALRRLGLATPPPFVGREDELAAVGRALRELRLLVVHGAVGAGKTRLALELDRRPEVIGSLSSAYVRCSPGDRAVAVRARAERSLDALPGSLAQLLEHQPFLLIIDDIHHLPEDDAARLLSELGSENGAGRVMVLTRDVLPLRRDRQRFEMNLDGLDEAAARELWIHHEETYGPTSAEAVDAALARTRGMPLALRREYARAAFGEDAWDLAALPDDVRAALEAVAVVRLPAAPAAIAALLGADAEPEPALIDLVSRQLIDPIANGRFAIHDVVRDEVLSLLDADARAALERAAADLVSTIGRGRGDARRLAWDAGDDGALGLVDPVDRMREAVLHLVEAGELEEAAARLVEDRAVATRRGGGGEILALIETIEHNDAALGARLAGLRAEIAARHGRVAEALELAGELDAVTAAELSFRAGDVDHAIAALNALVSGDDADQRCRAAASLAEVQLLRGAAAEAESLAAGAFERDRAAVGDGTRARLHLALAAASEHTGRVTAARAALSRAASSGGLDASLAALIEGRRARCLAAEGRLSEAEKSIAEAEQAAREVDAAVVADEVRQVGARITARRGDLLRATAVLEQLVSLRRMRGDEIGALRCELDLAAVLVRRGELAAASELAAACRQAAAGRKLAAIEARASVIAAAIDVAELRLDSARMELATVLEGAACDAELELEARSLMAQALAAGGDKTATLPEGITDEIDAGMARMAMSMALGDSSASLDAANAVAVRAERAGRLAEVADALAVVARLQLARGDRAAAIAAATRAAREAVGAGVTRARTNALLVLSALARESDDIPSASAYARDAAELAGRAGLPVERLIAAEAIDAIAGSADRTVSADAAEIRNAAAATMSQYALDAAGRALSDLGLTTVRPYRVVSAIGQESFVADADPDLLSMKERVLAVDGVREVIFREGEQTADLRRRSLLKRLLFMFAGAPGTIFSKEQIVETVWNVEYHPLRHDAALFTNIMRIRRLLGKDGADLIRVSEDGYRFCPPKDFIFVEMTGEA